MIWPVFPQEFVQGHCPKVQEARRQRLLNGGEEADDAQFAECSFVKRGLGMKCESCAVFLTRPYLGHVADEKYLPQIEDYYRKMEECEAKEALEIASKLEGGAGI